MHAMNMTRGSVGVDPMAASRRSAADRPGAGMGRAGKVLVVEDEADVAEMIRYNLGKEGYDVRLAANGTEALRQVKEARPDVILLDIMVPHLNGWEICRRLKQDRDTQAIPVIMVTGRVEEGDKVLGFEMGADDYVTKPFSPRELVARVRAVSRRGRPGEAQANQPLRAGSSGARSCWIWSGARTASWSHGRSTSTSLVSGRSSSRPGGPSRASGPSAESATDSARRRECRSGLTASHGSRRPASRPGSPRPLTPM